MLKRIIAIAIIIAGTTVGWKILSNVVNERTQKARSSMKEAVGGLWGKELHQFSPEVRMEWEKPKKEIQRYLQGLDDREKLAYLERRQQEEDEAAEMEDRVPRILTFSRSIFSSFSSEQLKKEVERQTRGKNNVLVLCRENYFNPEDRLPPEFIHRADDEFIKKWNDVYSRKVEPASSDIKVSLKLDPRKKGLLWFSTYKVDFRGRYVIKKRAQERADVKIRFYLPGEGTINENLEIKPLGNESLKYDMKDDHVKAVFAMEPNTDETAISFSYSSRGMNQWIYKFKEDTSMIKNFNLTIATDFHEIDFPGQSISPDEKQKREKGWLLKWDKGSMLQAFHAGIVMPQKINPGPLAEAMSNHAPVSLLFFFFLIFILQTARGLKLHPMNYFFLACAFFSFNLLFAYLADQLELLWSFLISAGVSLFLVVSYLRLVIGTRFAILEAGLGQVVYQILFALAHFYEGYTGLSVTIIAIVTLAIVMRLTARTDWEEIFKDKGWGHIFRKTKQSPARAPSVSTGKNEQQER